MSLWLFVALVGAWGGCGVPDADPPEVIEAEASDDEGALDTDRSPSLAPLGLDVRFDATDTASGRVKVTLTYRGVDGPLSIKDHGDYAIDKVRLLPSDGEPTTVERKGSVYRLPSDLRGDVTVSYRFKPGADGRHGHQGWADDRFAVFDGRALLLPISTQPLGSMRARFELPDGWIPATALRPDEEGWWRADPPSGTVLLERLLKECHGVGPFRRDDLTLGNTTVLSFVHTDLEADLQEQVVGDTRAVWGWFHEVIGFDPGHPMAFVRTPTGKGDRIFGGASMMGACFEGRYNKEPERNTVLLGHRFGHPFNRYPPMGLSPAGPDESWFSEGWASYAEVVAAESTGRLPAGTYFPHLWSFHQKRVAREPAQDALPLDQEPVLGAEVQEYVHYFRGPLAVRALAHLVSARSDRTLEDFVRHLGQTAGAHRRLYHLQAELEAFTGASYADFWDAWVHGTVPMVPAFPGIVDDWVRDRAARPVTLYSAGYGMHADHLRWLAASGRFASASDLIAYVGAEGPRRRALAERGVSLVPSEVVEAIHGLGSPARDAIVRAEAAWPIHRVAEPLPREMAPQVRWIDGPDATVWQALLATEAADEALTLQGGIDRLALRVGEKKAAEERPDVLVVPPDEPITTYVWWREPRAAARLELYHDDVLTWSRDIVEEPGWLRNRLVVKVGDRPATPGRLTLRVLTLDGVLLGQRSFWQR